MVTGRSMVSCALPGCELPKSRVTTLAHISADERSIMLVARSRKNPAGYRHFAYVLGHLVALLHRRAFGDGRVPALDVGILFEFDGLPFAALDQRSDHDIGVVI